MGFEANFTLTFDSSGVDNDFIRSISENECVPTILRDFCEKLSSPDQLIRAELQHITGHEDFLEQLDHPRRFCWIAYRDDMLTLSSAFPTVLFELEVVTESGEMWKDFFQQGKTYRAVPKIDYDKFNQNMLSSPELPMVVSAPMIRSNSNKEIKYQGLGSSKKKG